MTVNTRPTSVQLYEEKKERHVYRAYGLSIHSAIPLPELVPGSETAEVIIRYGPIESLPFEPDSKAIRYIQTTSEGIILAWRGVGTFLVRGGCEIIVDPAPDVPEAVLRLFILGTTLAMLLHQRGKMVFHASVAALGGQAVAFIGPKGAGKSTMAATFRARGHNLVSDDLLVINPDRKDLLALPGFPHLKLWSDAITSLGDDPEHFPQLRPDLNTEKRGQRINTGFISEPVPLKCIFFLHQGPELRIEPIRPQEALKELMPHWYGARFGSELLQALGLSNHFLQCVTLARQVPVFLLRRPASLLRLSEVAQLVEHHILEQAFGTESRQVDN